MQQTELKREARVEDALDNLSRDLEIAAADAGQSDSNGECDIRRQVIEAARECSHWHLELARALWRYRAFYKGNAQWMVVSEAVARAVDLSGRTIRRLVEYYDLVNEAPAVFFDAMKAESLNPVAKKHASLVTNVIPMIRPEMELTEARAVVKQAAISNCRKNEKVGSKQRKDQLFGYASRLYSTVDPAERQAEIVEVFHRITNYFAIEGAA
jgi:hypothetical protein